MSPAQDDAPPCGSYELFFLVYLSYAGVPLLPRTPPSGRCGGRQGSKGSAAATAVLLVVRVEFELPLTPSLSQKFTYHLSLKSFFTL